MEPGPEIKIEGKRPEWLKDDEYIGIVWFGGSRWENLNTAVRNVEGWSGSITAIMLPADHPYYLATSRGYTYWPSGDSAPDDWDGGPCLLRDGEVVPSVEDWRVPSFDEEEPQLEDIIGYRKRAEPQAIPAKDDSDYVQVKRMTEAEFADMRHSEGVQRWARETGIIRKETPLERFEREHGDLDNNQRDIVAAYIAWKEKQDA